MEDSIEIIELISKIDESVSLYYEDNKKEIIKLIYMEDYFIFKGENFPFNNYYERLNFILQFMKYRAIRLNFGEVSYDIYINMGILPIHSDIYEFHYIDIVPHDIIKLRTYEVKIFSEELWVHLQRRVLVFKSDDKYYILYFINGEYRMGTDYISNENMFLYHYYNIDRLINLNQFLLNSSNKNALFFRKLFLNDFVDFNILGGLNSIFENINEKEDVIFIMEMKKYLFDFRDFRNSYFKKLFEGLKKNKRFKNL